MSALSFRLPASGEDVLTDGGLVRLNGAAVRFDPAGVLFWPAESLLVVADLHLEKGSAQAVHGQLVPPYDTRQTLAQLARAIERLQPDRVIALGDSFHDRRAESRLAPADLEQIRMLTTGREWIWIAGNHDPAPPAAVGGRAAETVSIGPLVFRHAPLPGRVPGEVAGHLHPVARIGLRGRSVRRRAFASDGQRLLLPAFGAYTGGLNVMSAPCTGLFDRARLIAWMIGEGRVYPVRGHQLIGD